MPAYNVTLDFSNLLTVADEIERRVMQKVHDGIGVAAQAIQNKWVDAVMAAPGIWTPERQAYAGSIKWRYTTHTSAVVETTLPLADQIENGRPAKDLKKMLGSSPKVRQGKKGRYLIIPFRHNVPSGDGHSSYAKQMPAHIYAAAKQLSPSKITGTGTRVSGTGAYDIKTKKLLTVPQHKYAWGESLPAGMAPKMKSHHKTDIYAGMKRFDTSTGKAKSSAYLTFRVMSEHSSGWIVPAKPGLHIARAIAQEVNKAVEDGIEAAG